MMFFTKPEEPENLYPDFGGEEKKKSKGSSFGFELLDAGRSGYHRERFEGSRRKNQTERCVQSERARHERAHLK
jgi:hypothetical protein